MHWHLIHTKPRQEKQAFQNLQQQGYSCYLPMLPIEKLCRGNLGAIDEPLFPRYLFIQWRQGNSAESWAPIRSTKGVNRLVCFGADPVSIDNTLIELLYTQETYFQDRPEQLYKTGKRVRLTEGSFAGIEAIYQMADGERRVMALVELLSKPVMMRVPLVSLRKIN